MRIPRPPSAKIRAPERSRLSQALVLVVAATLASPRRSTATYPGHVGKISFTSQTAYTPPPPASPILGNEIRTLDTIDGSGNVALTSWPSTAAFRNPRWSPTGTRLASWEGLLGGPKVYLVILDTTQATIGTSDETLVLGLPNGNVDNAGPTWSPDGTKLAIALGAAGGGVSIVDVATQSVTPVLTNPSADLIYDQPAWSPDGQSIAVRIHQSSVGIYGHRDDIGIVPAAGGPVTNLTQNHDPAGYPGDFGCFLSSPNWAPDSSRIVYSLGVCDAPPVTNQFGGVLYAPAYQLATVTAPGAVPALLTPTRIYGFFDSPVYSPDGGIVVAVNHFDIRQLWFFQLGSGTETVVTLPPVPGSTQAPGASYLDWQSLGSGSTCSASLDAAPARATPRSTAVPLAATGTTFTVNSTSDAPDDSPGDGRCHTAGARCTLRAAILEANATPTPDTVTFAIPRFSAAPPVIQPATPLPEISAPIVLDGSSQSCVMRVELDGSAAGMTDGLVVTGGASTIRGFVINRFGRHGVVLRSDGNQLSDSVIGAGPDGKCAPPCALGNRGSGVWIEGSGNVVGNGSLANLTRGGPFPEAPQNTISFNGDDGVTVKSGTRNNVGGNVLVGNGDLAIDLGGDGLDKNDKNDADSGPNERMNSPVVLAANKVGNKTDNPISGFILNSGALYRGKPNAELRAFVYAVTECARPDKPSAAYLLGGNYLTLSDQGTGDPSITVIETNYDFPIEDATGLVYAAVDADGNTSELSNCALDADGDGINDFWEESGADLDRDGVVDIPLNEMGASPKHPDIFVEVDATGAQALDDTALDRVREAFRRAPVTNPLDGSTGVHIHIDNGPNSEMFPGTTWGSRSRADRLPKVTSVGAESSTGMFIWDEVYAYKRQHMDADRVPFFHYVLATNEVGAKDDGKGKVLGISNGIGGSEVLLGLGPTCPARVDCPGSPELQAGVFMHELGHNLGLKHGGSSNENFLPTYLSIMNYSFVPGVKLVDTDAWLLDYSRVGSPSNPGAAGAVADINEAHLVESSGLGPTGEAVKYSSMYRCADQLDEKGGGFTRIENLAEPIDWNCNDTTDASEIKADINGDMSAGSPMEGYADWPHLVYKGGSIGQGRYATLPSDLTPSEPIRTNVVLDAAKALQGGGEPPIIRLHGPRRAKRRARFTLSVRSTLPLGGVTTVVDGQPTMVKVPKPVRAPRKKRKGSGYLYRIGFVVQGAGNRAVQAFVTDRALVSSAVAAASVTLR